LHDIFYSALSSISNSSVIFGGILYQITTDLIPSFFYYHAGAVMLAIHDAINNMNHKASPQNCGKIKLLRRPATANSSDPPNMA